MTESSHATAARVGAAPHYNGRRFSEVMEALAACDEERISVARILDAFGDRAFGALMLVFAAPNILPAPPGTSAVLGAPLLFITAQLMVGRSVLWLPRFITERSLSRSDFATFVGRMRPWFARAERLLRPRAHALLGPLQDRVIGAITLVLAIILFLPIPFGNITTGIPIAFFALGLVERDGYAVVAGWVATAGCFAVLAVVWGAIVAALAAFVGYFFPGV